jgi:hypothetical protein
MGITVAMTDTCLSSKGLAALLCWCYVSESNLLGHGAYSGWSEAVLHHWAQPGHIVTQHG